MILLADSDGPDQTARMPENMFVLYSASFFAKLGLCKKIWHVNEKKKKPHFNFVLPRLMKKIFERMVLLI